MDGELRALQQRVRAHPLDAGAWRAYAVRLDRLGRRREAFSAWALLKRLGDEGARREVARRGWQRGLRPGAMGSWRDLVASTGDAGEARCLTLPAARRSSASAHWLAGLGEASAILCSRQGAVTVVGLDDLAPRTFDLTALVGEVGSSWRPYAEGTVGDDIVAVGEGRIALVDPAGHVVAAAAVEESPGRIALEDDIGVMLLERPRALRGIDLSPGRFAEVLWTRPLPEGTVGHLSLAHGGAFVLLSSDDGLSLAVRDALGGELRARAALGAPRGHPSLVGGDTLGVEVLLDASSSLSSYSPGEFTLEARALDGGLRWRAAVSGAHAVVATTEVVAAIEDRTPEPPAWSDLFAAPAPARDLDLRLVARERTTGRIRWERPLPWSMHVDLFEAPRVAPCDLALAGAGDAVHLVRCHTDGVDALTLDLASGALRGRARVGAALRRHPDQVGEGLQPFYARRLIEVVALEGGLLVLAEAEDGTVVARLAPGAT